MVEKPGSCPGCDGYCVRRWGDRLADGMEHRVVGALIWRLCGGCQDSSPGSEGQGTWPGPGPDAAQGPGKK